MKYFYGEYIKNKQDNYGKIIIYQDYIMYSYIKDTDYDYLLKALISKYKLNNDVYNKAIKLYFIYEKDRIIISPVRKIDNEEFNKNYKKYGELIKKNIG